MSTQSTSLRWLDFEMDSFFGPLLDVPGEENKFRKVRFARPSVMDDAVELKSLQETGQEQWPARMAGLPDSESNSDLSIEARRVERIVPLRAPKEGE